jgi:hypothetical protein
MILGALFPTGSESIHGFRLESGNPFGARGERRHGHYQLERSRQRRLERRRGLDDRRRPAPGDGAIISVLGGPYTVTVSSADFANSLAVNADQATLLENSGSLTIAGGLHVISGLVSLNKANTIGAVTLAGGTLAVGNAGALGTGTVTQTGGELLGTANETLTNALSLSGTSTIAAAHGTTLTEKMSTYNIAENSTLIFGAPGQDGTVDWDGTAGDVTEPLPIQVRAGTFKGGNVADRAKTPGIRGEAARRASGEGIGAFGPHRPPDAT